ncbi:MAG: beta-propeller fold lactonase family protein, partial [Candidatus Zixiibacteriota bacterium]
TSSPNSFVSKATLAAGTLPTAIAVTLNGVYGYIADFTDKNTDGKIIKYNLGTMVVVPVNLQTGRGTHDIKITHDGTRVIACNRFTDDITIVNVSNDSVDRVSLNEADPSLPGKPKYGPYGIAITSTDSLAYVACLDSNSHQVRVYDITRDSVVDSIMVPVTATNNPSLPAGPCLMALSGDNQVLWITTYWGNTVVAVNPITKQILAEIPFSTGLAFGVSLSDDNTRAYVACANAPGATGMVYIINTANYEKIDSLSVGKNSYMVHYHPVHSH